MVNRALVILVFFLPHIFMINKVRGQEDSYSESGPAQKISYYTGFTAPQKVYLHLNKNNYKAGDAIWFQAYLFDGVSHLPDTTTTNLYVDLANGRGEIMEKRILRVTGGQAEGDINLSRELPDGNYKIRAYTDWMRNFDEEFFYTGYLYINNDNYANFIPRSEVRSNRRFNRNLESLGSEEKIVFFPEGGQMVAGVSNRVAFKAFDGMGRGIDVAGEVLGENSRVVARIESVHAGTGKFELTPRPGVSYSARVTFSGNRPVTFPLPQPVPSGIVMRVDQDDNNIRIDLASSEVRVPDHDNERYTVIVHTRGNLVGGESVSLSDGKASIEMSKEFFPSGIAHITLFSENQIPHAERLVFVSHDDSFLFYPGVSRQTVGNREYYVVSIEVNDKEGNPVDGYFSLSVLQSAADRHEVKDNIVRNLLLSSDLPGISTGGYNFSDPDTDMSDELDLLMMTNGWRRFKWDDVLSGAMPEIRHTPSSSLTISGNVIDQTRDQSMANFPVDLVIPGEENRHYNTDTNTDGVFIFDDLIFYDNVRVRISSERTASSGHPPKLELHAMDTRNIGYDPNPATVPFRITDRGDDWERRPGAGTSQYSRAEKQGESPQQYGTPDQTVFIEQETKQSRMRDILVTRVRGLNHNMQFSGPTSLYLSSEPLFMLDGTEVGSQAFLNLDPRYIQRIEVFSGARASIFGVRGANGALLAYTRRAGDPGMEHYQEYLVQGYHSPREYFADMVSSYLRNEDQSRVDKSIYWEPGLETDESGRITTAVPVSGDSGTLTFIIEGAGRDGGIGFGTFSLIPADR